jgi:hypothetical protein
LAHRPYRPNSFSLSLPIADGWDPPSGSSPTSCRSPASPMVAPHRHISAPSPLPRSSFPPPSSHKYLVEHPPPPQPIMEPPPKLYHHRAIHGRPPLP